jgi:hypothetical protein
MQGHLLQRWGMQHLACLTVMFMFCMAVLLQVVVPLVMQCQLQDSCKDHCCRQPGTSCSSSSSRVEVVTQGSHLINSKGPSSSSTITFRRLTVQQIPQRICLPHNPLRS